MKFEHLIIALLIPAGLLLIAGGAAFQQFQYWAIAQSYAASSSAQVPQVRSLPEMRVVSNRPLPVSTSAVSEPNPDVVSLSVRPGLALQTAQPASVAQAPTTRPGASLKPEPNFETKPETKPESKHASKLKPPGLVVESALASVVKQNHASSAFPLQPIVVVYDNEIVIEFPKQLATPQNIKRAVSRVLLSPDPYAEQDLLSLQPLEYRQRPAFYRRVVDAKQQPIRYPRAAFEYADYLMANNQTKTKDQEGEFVSLRIPLQTSNLAEPARQYEPWVLGFAQDFNIDPALVFAVMETESHFNPQAVSRSQAKGLMQIKPNAAGRDVYQYVDFRLDAPSDADLFDAENNIRIGTAYLSLLKYDYFADIQHPESREMVAISSYNGGMSTVWRLFGDTPEQAVEQINKLNPRQVYRKLRYDHASDETRRYLDKVLQAKARYQAILGEDANLIASR
ncbi:MAG: DUF3393 domain-containing protein [Thiomicrospira sp.]|uniref:murein transglycosylase domain-containing protein n=1 Tax=Thiomicrospira sp. TaxID=935 RepID=UPI0019EF36AB|nr:murein transglycosylase domain-containing protein [Thiomicrospira sp.]MBE0494052.1 DUF3393 domain-containing protein [Thiomicrospira sp.]